MSGFAATKDNGGGAVAAVTTKTLMTVKAPVKYPPRPSYCPANCVNALKEKH